MKSFLKALRSGHFGSLVGALLYFDVSFMVWVLVGVLGVFIAGDLGLSNSQKGIMVAVPALGGAIFRIVVGLLADRFGPKRIGLVSMSAVVLPLVWGWWGATTFHEVVAVGLLLGIAGASFAVAIPLASRSYPPEHQGLAMGIAGAGNSGTVFAALFAPRLAQEYGWHGVFGLALLPVAFILILFFLLAREAPSIAGGADLRRQLKRVWRPDLWHFCLFYSLTFGGFVGLAGFLGIFLHDEFATPAVMAGSITALCVAAGSLFRPVGGYLADRLGGAALLFWLFLLMETCFVAVSFTQSLWIAVGVIVLGMSALGAGNGAVFQMVPQRFREEMGVVTGIVGAAGGVGGFLFPLLLGVLREGTGSYHAGFSAFVLAIHLSLFPLKRYRHAKPVPESAQPSLQEAAEPITMEPTVVAAGWDGRRIRMEVTYAES